MSNREYVVALGAAITGNPGIHLPEAEALLIQAIRGGAYSRYLGAFEADCPVRPLAGRWGVKCAVWCDMMIEDILTKKAEDADNWHDDGKIDCGG